MKRMSAAAARQHFSDLLDATERGEGVVIERRGLQFELKLRQLPKARARRASLIEAMDPALEGGQWTWRVGRRGLVFASRKARA